MDWKSFLVFVLLSAITPGPNNIMSMANARKNGFYRGLRFNWGVWIGFTFVLAMCAAFCTLLSTLIPRLEPYMYVLGALYILYLAWTVLVDKPHEQKASRLRLNSVFTGAVMQLINPKAIMYGITAFSAYILPHYSSIPVLAVFCVLLAFAGFACTCLWAGFGASFERLFSRYAKLINGVMVALLAYCAVMLLWDAYLAFVR